MSGVCGWGIHLAASIRGVTTEYGAVCAVIIRFHLVANAIGLLVINELMSKEWPHSDKHLDTLTISAGIRRLH